MHSACQKTKNKNVSIEKNIKAILVDSLDSFTKQNDNGDLPFQRNCFFSFRSTRRQLSIGHQHGSFLPRKLGRLPQIHHEQPGPNFQWCQESEVPIFYISGAIQGTDSQVQKMAVGQMVWILPAVWSNMLSAGLRTNLRDPEMLLGAYRA